MPGYAEIQNIAAMLLRGAEGEKANVGLVPVYFGVWPSYHTLGPRAEAVLVYSSGELRFAVDTVPNTSAGGIIHASTPYAFPLHPEVNTLGFIVPTNTSASLEVTWLRTR